MVALAVGVVLRLGDRSDGDVQALLLQRGLARLELREEKGEERQSASLLWVKPWWWWVPCHSHGGKWWWWKASASTLGQAMVGALMVNTVAPTMVDVTFSTWLEKVAGAS